MIEFKGECGHTIRAKDEDAGKVVRCSYCGHEAPVPDEREDHLDFLLNEVERTGEFKATRGKRSAKAKSGEAGATPGRRSEFNPFAVALKMCYAAIIITVLIVAGRFAYRQLGSADRRPAPTKPAPKAPSSGGAVAMPEGGGTARGLLRPELPSNAMGILINAVPMGAQGAQVYVRRQSAPAAPGAPADGSILQKPDQRAYAGVKIENLPGPGTYEVAVALPVLHPHLTALPDYLKQWREYEDASPTKENRLKLFTDYFLPDRCKRVSVEALPDHSQVIVRYYEMQVYERSWTVETALFLPRRAKLSELVKFLPPETLFGFDPAPVKAVLASYEVDVPDQTYILDALARVGMIPYYVEKKNSYRLFFLGVADGAVSTVRLD
jgi:hypothetical protein